MTEAQRKRFYGPAWRAAWKACWQVDRGTILPRPGRPEAHADSGLPTPGKVEEIASGFARREFRRVAEHDLRRAVRMLALGRDIPDGNTLGHQDLQRVVVALDLLVDPDRLESVMAWQDSRLALRRSLVAGVERAAFGEAYLRHMAEQIYGTPNWRALDPDRLRAFARLVYQRAEERRRALAATQQSAGGGPAEEIEAPF